MILLRKTVRRYCFKHNILDVDGLFHEVAFAVTEDKREPKNKHVRRCKKRYLMELKK